MYKIIGSNNRQLLVRRSMSLLTLLTAVMVVFLFGCRDELTTDLDTNRAPDTYVTGAPMESTTAFYRVHLWWYGNDVDGVVTGYEYAITDSMPADEDTLTYSYTTRTDSMFSFPVEANQQVVGHRFYIRAIDDQNAEDPEPAVAFFGASDLNPPSVVFTAARAFKSEDIDFPADWPFPDTVQIFGDDLIVPTDTIPAGYSVEFEWMGFDSDSMITETGELVPVGYIQAFEYIVKGKDNVPTRIGKDVTRLLLPADEMSAGMYAMQLWAIDDAGFMGMDPEARSFMWNYDPETHFELGWQEGMTDSLPMVSVTCDEWPDDSVSTFFAGDTIPLSDDDNDLNLEFVLWGYDPDDYTGEGLTGFEYKKGSERFKSTVPHPEPNHGVISYTRAQTTSTTLAARCADQWGKKTGDLALYRLVVNQAPILRDTVYVVEDVPVMRFPLSNEPISAESIMNWDNRLYVRTQAIDPDNTVDQFEYSFRISPRGSQLFSEPSPIRWQLAWEAWLELPDGYIETGDTLLTRVKEYRTGRIAVIKTPLVITR